MAALAIFGGALLGTEWILATAERRLGSQLEARLRIALLEKIPRLSDRYFRSRPMSDMAERSHSVHNLRLLPSLGIRCLRTAMELVLTTAAIVWLDPSLAIAIAGALATAAISILGHSIIGERDLRHRTHAGALSRFHLDALLGRSAIDAHNAATTLEREHEHLLEEWMSAGAALQRSTVVVEGLQITVGFCVAGWLIFTYFDQRTDMNGMLLLVYWVLSLPALAYELALNVREYPFHRSTILRLLEPLESVDDIQDRARPTEPAGQHASVSLGADIDLRGATVVASEQTILEDISVHMPSGSHVAIVGASGAGKSTLVSLLLGWHSLADGEVLVDGHPLAGGAIEKLRRPTAWVDPTVQIWNRSLFDNLLYGSDGADSMTDASSTRAQTCPSNRPHDLTSGALDSTPWPLWSKSRVGEALFVLAAHARLPLASVEQQTPPPDLDADAMSTWIEIEADRGGFHAEPRFVPLADIDALIASAHPALLRLRAWPGEPFLALVGRRGRMLTAVGPDRRFHRIRANAIRDAICRELETPLTAEIDRSVDALRLAPAKRARARAALLRERLAPVRFRGCWVLRLPAGAGVRAQARDAQVPHRLAVVVGAHLVQYTLWLLSWCLLGRGALTGTVDKGWLIGWALLLASLVPFRLLGTWTQGLALIGIGASLRRRLLHGALRMDPSR